MLAAIGTSCLSDVHDDARSMMSLLLHADWLQFFQHVNIFKKYDICQKRLKFILEYVTGGGGGRGTYFLIIFYDNKPWNLCQRFWQKDPVLQMGGQEDGLDLRGWPAAERDSFWVKHGWMRTATVSCFCARGALSSRIFGASDADPWRSRSLTFAQSQSFGSPSSEQGASPRVRVSEPHRSEESTRLTRGVDQLTRTQAVA